MIPDSVVRRPYPHICRRAAPLPPGFALGCCVVVLGSVGADCCAAGIGCVVVLGGDVSTEVGIICSRYDPRPPPMGGLGAVVAAAACNTVHHTYYLLASYIRKQALYEIKSECMTAHYRCKQ